MSFLLRSVVAIIFLVNFAKAGDLKINVYKFPHGNKSHNNHNKFVEDSSWFDELKFFGAITFSITDSKDPKTKSIRVETDSTPSPPHIPSSMRNPTFRCERLKNITGKSQESVFNEFLNQGVTGLKLRIIHVSKRDNNSFSITTTYGEKKEPHGEMEVDPWSMFNLLCAFERKRLVKYIYKSEISSWILKPH